jgi:F-type H+-transporting ATPase subunit alpha
VNDAARTALRDVRPVIAAQEVGIVQSIGHGIARVSGLPGIRAEELIRFAGGVCGMVLDIEPTDVGVVLLGAQERLSAGAEARRSRSVLDVPVGPELLGRVVNPLGAPLDGRGPVTSRARLPVEREAPAIVRRGPVRVPLQTGIKVIDALIPIGRGQRQLIMGDRQTGKTAIAVDAILNQAGQNVICVYCAVGQQSTATARVLADLTARGALEYSTVVVAEGDDPPGLRFIAPYAATAMAEYFVEQGRDVLVVYDDLTRHAIAYRELSLLLRRPPGREAFPGDIFYVHSRLLERATRYRTDAEGGSLTALPIVETEAQNIAGYIPTNLISITDGQIYLSPELFRKGVLPAVDVGKSVSRVGGKTQLPAYRAVVGPLRLTYAQFEELEAFARFGTRLDAAARQAIERGRRVREVLKQSRGRSVSAPEQIAVMLAATEGLLDSVPLNEMDRAERLVCNAAMAAAPGLSRRILAGDGLRIEDSAALIRAMLSSLMQQGWHGHR